MNEEYTGYKNTQPAAVIEAPQALLDQLRDSVVDYLYDHDLPTSKEYREIARQVLMEQYELGAQTYIDRLTPLPPWKTVMKEGKKVRAQIVDEGRKLVNLLRNPPPDDIIGEPFSYTLAIPNEAVTTVSEELKDPHRSPSTQQTRFLLALYAAHTHVIQTSALSLLSHHFELPVDQLHTFISTDKLDDPRIHAKIIRGALVGSILALSGFEEGYSAVSIGPEALDAFIGAAIDLSKLPTLQASIVTNLTQHLDQGQSHPEVIRTIVATYLEQIIHEALVWQGSAKSQLLADKRMQYWTTKQRIFALLPLDSVTDIYRFGFTPDDLQTDPGRPHLWTHGIALPGFEGVLLPGPQDIATGLMLVRYEMRRWTVSLEEKTRWEKIYYRLVAAQKAWRQHDHIQSTYPARIANLKEQHLSETPNDYSFGISKSAQRLAEAVGSYKPYQRLKREYEHVLETAATLEPAIQKIQDGAPQERMALMAERLKKREFIQLAQRKERLHRSLQTGQIMDIPHDQYKDPIAWRSLTRAELQKQLDQLERQKDSLKSSEPLSLDYIANLEQVAQVGTYLLSLRGSERIPNPRRQQLQDLIAHCQYHTDQAPIVLRAWLQHETFSRIGAVNELIQTLDETAQLQEREEQRDPNELLQAYTQEFMSMNMRVVPREILTDIGAYKEARSQATALVDTYDGYELAGYSLRLTSDRQANIAAIAKAQNAVDTYAYRHKDEITAFLRTFVQQLDNPLLPFEHAQGVTLGAFMAALRWRLKVLEATQNLQPGSLFLVRLERARREKDQLQGEAQKAQVDQKIKDLAREQEAASAALVKTMQQLDLVLTKDSEDDHTQN